ncbi:MAG TPA: AMP-binding protein [Gemmataceae bacterium]|nr:AMP-binding protein [Gemmataceae bacterium]
MSQSPDFPNFANLIEACLFQAETQPDQIAFTFLVDGELEEQNLSYSDLDRQARAVAARLQSVGRRGDRVLLFFAPGLEYVVGFYACQYAGMIAVPAYPPDLMRLDRTFNRLQVILQDCQAQVILGTTKSLAEARPFLPNGEDLALVPVDPWADWTALPWSHPDLTGDDLALLQYTSGSTSTPRGVQVSQGNLIYQVREAYRWAGEHFLGVSWLPLYHDLGLVGGVVCPVYSGRRVILMSPLSFMQRPMRWLEAISRYRATTSGGPNFAYDLCVRKFRPQESPNLDLGDWRFAVNGAEPIRPETLESFTRTFEPFGFRYSTWCPSYGLAEATLGVSGVNPNNPDEPVVVKSFDGAALEQNHAQLADESSKGVRTLVSCGKTLVDTEAAIVDPHSHTLCPADGVGEIWVRSPSVSRGYWQRPEENQITFNAYLADSAARPFLRTGDLGFFHDGGLYITGRLKDLIILQGRNIYPNDIEQSLPAIHAAFAPHGSAAFAIDQDEQEQLVVVQEVLRPGKLDLDSLAQDVRGMLLREHQVWLFALAFIKGGTLPKTSSGKVQRFEARRKYLAGELSVLHQWTWDPRGSLGPLLNGPLPPAPAIQDWIVTHLAQHYKLDAEQIDVHQSIRSYVMDSITLMALALELETWLGRAISPLVIFDAPSIAELSRRLADPAAASVAAPICGQPAPPRIDDMTEAELDKALEGFLEPSP